MIASNDFPIIRSTDLSSQHRLEGEKERVSSQKTPSSRADDLRANDHACKRIKMMKNKQKHTLDVQCTGLVASENSSHAPSKKFSK